MIRGFSIEITDKLTPNSAMNIAQWIGGFNVIRNQKIKDYNHQVKTYLESGKVDSEPEIDGKVSYLLDREELSFLRNIPSHIRRNAGAAWCAETLTYKSGDKRKPKIRGKHKKRACYVTKELFTVDKLNDTESIVRLRIDGKKCHKHAFFFQIRLPFTVDQACNSLYLSRQGKRFWLSIGYDNRIEFDEKALKQTLHQKTLTELEEGVVGFDLGVKQQVTRSDGFVYHLTEETIKRLEALERKKIRIQKKLSRKNHINDQKAGTKKRKRTNSERKLSQHMAKISTKVKNIRLNTSHHISKAIANDTPCVAAFENLKITNLTRRPKAKQCPKTGRWLRNGAKAKSSLNKDILNLNLGQIRQFAEYKLRDQQKLMIKVKTAYSSQECSECGHTDTLNRPSQAVFVCQQCGHEDHADHNAAKVIKQRGISAIHSSTFTTVKTSKKIKPRKESTGVRNDILGQIGLDKTGIMLAQSDKRLNGHFQAVEKPPVNEASPDLGR